MQYVRSKMQLNRPISSTQTLPDFVIACAGRAGTTSLAAALERHAAACFSRIKGTNYFTPPDFGLTGLGDRQFIYTVLPIKMDGDFGRMEAGAALIRSRVLYEAMFAHRADGQLCGEASPAYLYYHAMQRRRWQRAIQLARSSLFCVIEYRVHCRNTR